MKSKPRPPSPRACAPGPAEPLVPAELASGPEAESTVHETGSAADVTEIDARSVLLAVDTSKRPSSGVRLADLDGEEALSADESSERKYTIIRELGAGGMGEVYLAYDRDVRRRVALKIIRQDSPDMIRRLLEEAQVLGQLQHPNIVPMFEVGVTGGRPYYTMPVVGGRALSDVIRALRENDLETHAEFSLVRRMQVLVQIGQALSYAHARGVVHRDLKPANVMLGEHGEVQVLDWGLAKVLDRATVDTGGAGAEGAGGILGTFAYMAPEQAKAADVDERADIYSLGVFLYEMLTLERPIETAEPSVMMAKLVNDPPRPPRALDGSIPLELEGVCLTALAKEPDARQQTADRFIAEIQEWLEASADRAKRRALADAKAEEGRRKFAAYRAQKDEVARLEAELEEVRERYETWLAPSEKGPLYAAENQLSAARSSLVEAASRVVETLERALEYQDDHAGARELLADYYWDRHGDAEADMDAEGMRFAASRVSLYHGGKYASELRGDGALTLTSDPPGARVTLFEMREEGPFLVERDPLELGTTPLAPVVLGMGSYLAVLEKDGYREVRYPVFIARNRQWWGQVTLYPDGEIGAGFVLVPGGPCILGRDHGVAVPLPDDLEAQVDTFVIAEHPVTLGEYLEFLNDLAHTEGLEAARSRATRQIAYQAETCLLLDDGEGGLKLPAGDWGPSRWSPRLPATRLSYDDARAYCAWRAARDGRPYRLPTEQEWEKAARGVDGRRYPWGTRFEPSLCSSSDSPGQAALAEVDAYPTDVSIYGVRGVGGNVHDWTTSEFVEGAGTHRRVTQVIRGGAWCESGSMSRAADRSWFVPLAIHPGLGIRLAFTP